MKTNSNKSFVVWMIGVLIVICSSNIQIVYSIINPAIQDELKLTIVNVSSVASINMVFFAIFQIFSGPIIDFYGLRLSLPISIIFITIGTFLLSTAHSFSFLLLSQLFLALGASFSFVGASYISINFFSKKTFGIMLGLVQTLYSIFSLIGQYLCVFLSSSGFYWRDIVNYTGCFSIMTLILSIIFIKDEKSVHKNISIRYDIYEMCSYILQTIKSKDLWYIMIIGSIAFGQFLAIAVLWGPRLLMIIKFSNYQSGVATSLIWLGFAIGCPVVTKISCSLRNNIYILLVFYIIQSLSAIALLYNKDFYFLCILMFIFGFSSGGHILSFTIGNYIVKSSRSATVTSVINSCMSITSAIIMYCISLIVNVYKEYTCIKPVLLIFFMINILIGVVMCYFSHNKIFKYL